MIATDAAQPPSPAPDPVENRDPEGYPPAGGRKGFGIMNIHRPGGGGARPRAGRAAQGWGAGRAGRGPGLGARAGL